MSKSKKREYESCDIHIDTHLHYIKVLNIPMVRVHFFDIENVETIDNFNAKLITVKRGEPIKKIDDDDILNRTNIFISNYLKELHSNNLYHGNLLYLDKNNYVKINYDNILFDKDRLMFIVKGFIGNDSYLHEKNLLKRFIIDYL